MEVAREHSHDTAVEAVIYHQWMVSSLGLANEPSQLLLLRSFDHNLTQTPWDCWIVSALFTEIKVAKSVYVSYKKCEYIIKNSNISKPFSEHLPSFSFLPAFSFSFLPSNVPLLVFLVLSPWWNKGWEELFSKIKFIYEAKQPILTLLVS